MNAHRKVFLAKMILIAVMLTLLISNTPVTAKEPVSLESDTNAPSNDDCTNAIEVHAGVPYQGSTEGATGTDTSSCSGSDDKDVWHIFTPTQSGLVVISLMGSSFDTTLAIYDQCGGTELICNDDSEGTTQSEITMSVDAGTSYLIRIAGYNHRTGDYTLTINYISSPENDDCTNAIEVKAGFPYLGSSIGATGNSTSGCGSFDDKDIWHIYTPTQSGTATISLMGSSFDTTLAVYDQCGGTELACNDNTSEIQSEVVMQVKAGTPYLLRIAGNNHQTGDYILNIYFPPPHDDCTNAIEVYAGIPYYGSTNGATGESTSSCYDTDYRDVWHVFTPVQSGLLSFSLLDSCLNTTLAIFDGCDGIELACNDNANNSPQSEITMQVQAGVTYYIRVAAIQNMTGDYVLSIEPASPPDNDECINAVEVQKGMYKGSTHQATGTTTSSCGLADDRDVWYLFIPEQSELVTISLWGSSFGTTLAVYDKCDGTELACSYEAEGTYHSIITMQVEAGSSYLIRVAGYNHRTGDYILTISSAASADECADAIEVFAGIAYHGNTFFATGINNSNCSDSDILDVWHIYTPNQSGQTTFSLMGSSFDTTLAVYDQCGGTELACNDDSNGTRQSEITMNVDANTPYLLRIAGYSYSKGYYLLTIEQPSTTPANDDCNNAIAITEGVPWNGSTEGATGNATSGCSDSDTLDVWHVFTPTQSGPFTISLAGSSFDTTLAVYDQCGGTELTCNDDAAGTRQSLITMSMDAGTSYLIRVAGYDNQTGKYVLTVSSINPPQNDECSNAIEITEGIPWYGSTKDATLDGSGNCSGLNDRDVWHIFTPTRTGLFIIRLYSAIDSSISVFDNCQGIELACNKETCNSANSELAMYMTENTTYLIRVVATNGKEGEYVIEVAVDPLLVTNEPDAPYPPNGASSIPVETALSWNGLTNQVTQAQNEQSQAKLEAVFGSDSRRDEYQINDPALLAAGDATVVLIPLSILTSNSDGSYTLPDQTLAEWYFNNTERVLCPNEPFRDQPAPGLCSGFLVAPDIIATTGNCLECPCELSDRAVVFGFVMLDANTPKLTVPAQDVYFVRDIVAMQTGYPDWALARLDRPVTGHTPLPLRRSGQIGDYQTLIAIGYPMGIPRKYDLGGSVRDNTPVTYFQADLDAYEGSNGSVVLNWDTKRVEGFIVRGHNDFISDPNLNCDRSKILPNYNSYWQDVTRITAISPLICSYDVYLGTDPANLAPVQSASAVTMFDPEILQPMTKYYWQIIARGPSGEKAGPVWEFTTGQ